MARKVPINDAIKNQQREIDEHIKMMQSKFERSYLVEESFQLTILLEALSDMMAARAMGHQDW
jgi:hypothetical protein